MVVSGDVTRRLGARVRIEVRPGPDVVLLILHGELDMATTPVLEATLAEVLGGGACPRLLVDLADLGFMDVCAVGCIVQAERRLAVGGGALAVRAPSPSAHRLLELCDLGGLLR